MRKVKQSAARNIMVLMVQASDHVSGLTGATLTVTLSKDGDDFASISPTVTERGNGWYNIALTAGHTDTLGDLALHITAASGDPTDVALEVVAYNPNDAAALGLSRLDAAISSRLASSGYTAPDNTSITAIKGKTDNLPADPAATGDAMALTAASVDDILDEVVEGSSTLRQLMRGFAAALLGKADGLSGTLVHYRDLGDSKNRITATVDANGNRSAVTLSLD